MGALGTLNVRNAKQRVAELRSVAQAPFMINMVLQLFPTNPPDILPVCLEAGAPVIQFSWGIPSRAAVSMVRAASAKFGVQVGSREGARIAVDAGADFLICQGTEAGGHVQSHRGLYELLPMVIEEARDIPVIAAGGIANGTGIYRALMAGSSGVLLGTRFVATRESAAHDTYKTALATAKSGNTALTMCFAKGFPQQHRVLRNSTFENWEAAGCPQEGQRPGEGDHVFTRNGVKVLRYDLRVPLAGSTGNLMEAAMYAGMGVGDVKDVPGAGELVGRLWREAEAARRAAR